MKNAIYVAESHDCAANLAGEAYLLTLDYDHVLYLWENDPCIVIGRYQNPFSECNLQRMEEKQVQLVRRHSGGGAVYHDRGNLCFTLIGNKETSSKEENFSLILEALSSLGIECELSGRNDILIQGKKVSGNAFQTTATKFCHHGTLLIQSDLSVMGQYLTPSSTKLSSKAVKSVSSRVGNLAEARGDISSDLVQQALIETFIRRYGPTEVQTVDFAALEQAQTNYRLFGDRSLILEKTPQFSHSFTHRFDWGEVTLHLQVVKGVITEVKLYTDALDTSLAERAAKALTGVAYDIGAIGDIQKQIEQADLASLLAHLVTLL
ncbi:MAG: lipoate--protein ligase [Sphaerochaeta sp.]|uniref:lipoate--protein ligase n=1 Tax=Sphaerochaeta sp. TaxID=1972642 RepID=UPI0029776C1C|nr:lipoate--protein ligase [uncultured Sphaerochaeta sp.]MDD3928539.1 lipoate--protein ligase [Sphaerochaeta sp.]